MEESRLRSRSALLRVATAAGLAAVVLAAIVGTRGVLGAPTATTWYVVPGGDDGDLCTSTGTACATIAEVVSRSVDGDTIELAAGTYYEHDVQLDRDLTVNGAGRDTTTVDAGGQGRVFEVTKALTLAGVTLRNGQTPAGTLFVAGGGAILAGASSRLTLEDARVVDNDAAGQGGAILNLGTLSIDNVEVISNTAGSGGGGIYNYNLGGIITVTQSLFAHNEATGGTVGGGAILAGGKSLHVSDSVLRENTTNFFGGAIYASYNHMVTLDRVTIVGNRALQGGGVGVNSGTMTATNTIVSGNVAETNYAGLYVLGSSGGLVLRNSTVVHNSRIGTAGTGYGGIYNANATTRSLVNTIVALNEDRNCNSSSSPTSLGYNLSDDYTCGLDQAGDQQGVAPSLAPLGDYGGLVPTHALLVGSPAIDAGDPATCVAVDARGIVRPFDGDGDGISVCDIGAYEARGQLTISDTTVDEGDVGSVTAAFTVTLAPTSTTVVEVAYATVDDTAVAGADYTAAADALVFSPGETEKVIEVAVIGDTADEPDEMYFVQLSSPVGADILGGEATGTILDDDGLGTLTVSDALVTEGDLGTVAMAFEVTLSPAGAIPVTVTYATVDGTASAGGDYVSATDQLRFEPGETEQTIPVDVLGDVLDEGAEETLSVVLSSPTNAGISDAEGNATIVDDDTARLRIGLGPTVVEGDTGLTPATFTVELTTPAAFPITVDFEAFSGFGDGGAKAGEDFVPISGTLQFDPEVVFRTFDVLVIGDEDGEPTEDFVSRIRDGSAPMQTTSSYGYILNDDDYFVYLPLTVR